MGLVKKGTGGALGKLRRQKEIRDKIEDGTCVSPGAGEALVIALDGSGSMCGAATEGDYYGPTKWDAAVDATNQLVQASRSSAIGIVVFEHQLMDAIPVGSSHDDIASFLARMGPSRGTCFTTALEESKSLLDDGPTKRVRRIVLLSDGRDGLHQGRAAFERVIQSICQALIVVDTVGFGPHADEGTLRAIADHTGGVYRHVRDGLSLVREFKQLEAGIRGLLGSGT